MKKYDFDVPVDRRGTGSMKYDSLDAMFGCNDVSPLWIADMDFAVCPEITKALRDRIDHPVYGYSAVPDSYWEAIQDWLGHRHGFRPAREELAFVPGIVRGIAYALNFFTSPGDKVVIQPPVYHPFRLVTEGNGRIVVKNPLLLKPDGSGYEMDLAGLEEIFANERPKMMILCNPHNPAGIQWDEDTLRRVAALARKYGVVVLSDEIHGDLMLYGKRHIPFATVSDDAAAVSVSFGAPSKTFNIAGLVSSWMIVRNPELRNPFYHWMEVNEFSSPFFTACIGAEAAYRNGEEWLDQMLEYIAGNIEAVERFCAEHMPEIRPMRPEASFLVWLDCRELGLSQKELVDLFLHRAKLALNDGAMFGSEGTGFMRLNVGLPRRELLRHLESLAAALHEVEEVVR